MALPDRNVATGWVGKTLVGRDGIEIGICAALFADDATRVPEWVSVELDGRAAFVPLIDAAESGGRVRVSVNRADVAGSPPVGDVRHLFEAEEAVLYHHYGIEASRSASDTLLPAGQVQPPPLSGRPLGRPDPATVPAASATQSPWLLALLAGIAGTVLGTALGRVLATRRSSAKRSGLR